MMIPSITERIFSMEESVVEKLQLENSFIHSDIDMDSLLTKAGSPRINFTLNNDEQEKLWDFKKFNLLINYKGITSGQKVEHLEYDGMCLGGVPAAGLWCFENISGDMEPGIMNEGESGIIRTQVNENLASSGVVVTLSTDRGVVSTLPAYKPTSIDISSNPPVSCQIGFYGRTFLDTDTGITYVCDPLRDKWLSLNSIPLWGDESGNCDPGDTPNNSDGCNVDWGNGLGPESNSGLGLYLPHNMTITSYGFSEDNDACLIGSFDLEVWGTGSNTDDDNFSLEQEIATGLTDEAHNSNNVDIDIDGDQYILWGIENNCALPIDDWNMILYVNWHHD